MLAHFVNSLFAVNLISLSIISVSVLYSSK